MKICLLDGGFSTHARLFTTRVAERVPTELGEDGEKIVFAIDATLGAPESYRIEAIDGGWQVCGTDELGLYFGIGKLLHSAKWSSVDFTPVATDGVVSPASSYRAIYYSKHFYNWYQVAPMDEQERYLEDLLLWGYNVVHTTLPTVNASSFDDPIFTGAIEQTHRIFKLAKKFGMLTSLSIGSNQGLKSAPAEFSAEISFDLTYRGNLGRNLCINKPGALDYLKNLWRHKLNAFTDVGLDFVTCWPYDEGGCGCEKCRPWGKRGYGDMCRAVCDVAR
ncbi:MAG: hypothetical protein IJW22_01365, partial [Clostridia bacterium]|nr:hypothetical protein [Clostridia bacterium]